MNSDLTAAFESEMALAGHLIRAGRLEQAMRHLERAHVLGQRTVMPHVRSHWGMLRIALKRHDWSEGLGQVLRIVIGAAGSATGIVPTGNTGRSDISMFARMPVDRDLAALTRQDKAGR